MKLLSVVAVFALLISGSVFASRVGGPAHSNERVDANDVAYFTLQMDTNRAAVFLLGDGDTDLDLYIFTSSGEQVCADTSSDDIEYCVFYPPYSGTYTIEVRNLGDVYNQFELMMN